MEPLPSTNGLVLEPKQTVFMPIQRDQVEKYTTRYEITFRLSEARKDLNVVVYDLTDDNTVIKLS